MESAYAPVIYGDDALSVADVIQKEAALEEFPIS